MIPQPKLGLSLPPICNIEAKALASQPTSRRILLAEVKNMATIPALLTIEEYLATTYRPDCDFVDDHIEERNLGEYDHSTVQAELVYWFRSRAKQWKIRVVPEYRTRVSSTRVRIPDIAIIAADAPREAVRVTPALICIEILSPEDRLARMAQRMDDYRIMGVPNLWIIDPAGRKAYTCSSSGTLPADSTRLEVPASPIYLDLPTIFRALD